MDKANGQRSDPDADEGVDRKRVPNTAQILRQLLSQLDDALDRKGTEKSKPLVASINQAYQKCRLEFQTMVRFPAIKG